MRWDITCSTTCDLYAFSGVNLSGQRTHIKIFPSGKVGDLDPGMMQSLIIVGPVGLRVVLMSSVSETDWESSTWRAVEIRKGKHYSSPKGNPAVNLPDIDLYEEYDAPRTDPDFSSTYPLVRSLDEGKTWTYGFKGPQKLKNNVRSIRIELLAEKPKPAPTPEPEPEPAAEAPAAPAKAPAKKRSKKAAE